jgi:protein TonB
MTPRHVDASVSATATLATGRSESRERNQIGTTSLAGVMRRIRGVVLPSRRRATYLLAALVLHLLVVGALLYVGTRMPMPSPPLPMVVVELLPAAEIAPPAPEPLTPAVPVEVPVAAPPPMIPENQHEVEVLTPAENGAAATAPMADSAAALPSYVDAPSLQELPQRASAVLPLKMTASTIVADARQQWESQVLQYLDQHKRYPAMAQFLGQEDYVSVRLRVSRDGTVLSHRIVSSRGYRRLDEEVVDLIGRASPLPLPPPEVADRDLEFRVAIAFSIVSQ